MDSQDTPEATLDTAHRMIQDGRTDQLTRLVYADNQDMRRLLTRTGLLLKNLGDLADAINDRWPEDVATLRAAADKAAAGGRPTSIVSQLTRSIAPRAATRRRGPPRGDDRADLETAIKTFLADPYASLRDGRAKLTTEYLTDDKVSLRYDAKPILPPIGVQLKLGDDGKWYFLLPTGLPGLAQYMPRTPREYQIWGSLVQVFDNVVKDLTADVRQNRVASLDQLSRRAGERAFVPAAMVFFAYSKVIKDRGKTPDPSTPPKP